MHSGAGQCALRGGTFRLQEAKFLRDVAADCRWEGLSQQQAALSTSQDGSWTSRPSYSGQSEVQLPRQFVKG